MTTPLKYYAPELKDQVQKMVDAKTLEQFLLSKYPCAHGIKNDGALRDHVMAIKNQYLKKSAPLSKVWVAQVRLSGSGWENKE